MSLFDKIGNETYQKKWINLIVISWILAAIGAFISLFITWATPTELFGRTYWDWIFLIFPMVLASLITIVPVLIILFHPSLRPQIYTSPSIGAITLLVLSFLFGFALLVVIDVSLREIDLGPLFSNRESLEYNLWNDTVESILLGFFIGVIAFPLTLGLVFPIVIPITCAMIVYSFIEETKKISRLAWNILMACSILGWMTVSVIGSALGYA